MIEFTVEEILIAERALINLAQAKLPIAVSYQISKTIKAVNDEMKTIRESQMKIAEKFGKKDDKGELIEENGVYPIEEGKQADFNKEMDALLKEKCALNIQPISITKLGDKLELSVSDLMSLGKLIVD